MVSHPLCVASLALLAPFVASQDQAALSRSDKQLNLVLHPGSLSEAMGKHLLEQCWQAAHSVPDFMKKDRVQIKKPLSVEVYAEKDAYLAVEKQRSPHAFTSDEFCDAENHTAHIALLPLPEKSYEVLGLPPKTRNSIIRLTAKLVAMQHDGCKSDAWLADVFSFGVLDEITNQKREWGKDPVFDQRALIFKARTETG